MFNLINYYLQIDDDVRTSNTWLIFQKSVFRIISTLTIEKQQLERY